MAKELDTPSCRTSGYVFSVPLIAGCPGLVPGWCAFLTIHRVPLSPPSARPFSAQPEHGWAEKGRAEGGAVTIAYCSYVPCVTPAQDRGSLRNAKQVLRQG